MRRRRSVFRWCSWKFTPGSCMAISQTPRFSLFADIRPGNCQITVKSGRLAPCHTSGSAVSATRGAVLALALWSHPKVLWTPPTLALSEGVAPGQVQEEHHVHRLQQATVAPTALEVPVLSDKR